MNIREFTGDALDALYGHLGVERPADVQKVSIADDGGIKVKLNEWTWSPPMGTAPRRSRPPARPRAARPWLVAYRYDGQRTARNSYPDEDTAMANAARIRDGHHAPGATLVALSVWHRDRPTEVRILVEPS